MKSGCALTEKLNIQSPLTREAWIEIDFMTYVRAVLRSPLTREAWIEILRCRPFYKFRIGRLSHERRGLKSILMIAKLKDFPSPLTREAWIEICKIDSIMFCFGSPLTREAWIEILGMCLND